MAHANVRVATTTTGKTVCNVIPLRSVATPSTRVCRRNLAEETGSVPSCHCATQCPSTFPRMKRATVRTWRSLTATVRRARSVHTTSIKYVCQRCTKTVYAQPYESATTTNTAQSSATKRWQSLTRNVYRRPRAPTTNISILMATRPPTANAGRSVQSARPRPSKRKLRFPANRIGTAKRRSIARLTSTNRRHPPTRRIANVPR